MSASFWMPPLSSASLRFAFSRSLSEIARAAARSSREDSPFRGHPSAAMRPDDANRPTCGATASSADSSGSRPHRYATAYSTDGPSASATDARTSTGYSSGRSEADSRKPSTTARHAAPRASSCSLPRVPASSDRASDTDSRAPDASQSATALPPGCASVSDKSK